MKHETPSVTCQIDQHPSKNGKRARVVIKNSLVSALYKEALKLHQNQIQTRGFGKGSVPRSYLEQAYRVFLLEHMKEFILNHCVINALCESLCDNHTLCIGDPTIESIGLQPESQAEFTFLLNQGSVQEKTKWNAISFQQPKRRNYKDIDKQVETFLTNECLSPQNQTTESTLQPGDWTLFSISLIDSNKKKSLLNHTDNLWLRLGTDEPDYEAVEIFKGRSVGDTFTSNHVFFQQYLSKQWDSEYQYQITICNHIPGKHLPKEHIAQIFFCKNEEEIKELCVQMFSFRQDLSLRRETVEQLFKTLYKNFQIEIPQSLISQQERYVLQEVQKTPDYPVYRLKKDFKAKVRQLAEKQLRETSIIDHIAAQNQIRPEEEDVIAYIALHTNPRTRDLINFDLPPTQVNGQEQPIPASMIKLSCLREKTLNFVLKNLTRTI